MNPWYSTREFYRAMERIKTVSYTHLDVYKRQQIGILTLRFEQLKTMVD